MYWAYTYHYLIKLSAYHEQYKISEVAVDRLGLTLLIQYAPGQMSVLKPAMPRIPCLHSVFRQILEQ
jgi:hypothetical protein